jgi:hypothetical protein
MLERIRWIVSFSARLQPQGPWVAFAQGLGLRGNPQYCPMPKKTRLMVHLFNQRRKGVRQNSDG